MRPLKQPGRWGRQQQRQRSACPPAATPLAAAGTCSAAGRTAWSGCVSVVCVCVYCWWVVWRGRTASWVVWRVCTASRGKCGLCVLPCGWCGVCVLPRGWCGVCVLPRGWCGMCVLPRGWCGMCVLPRGWCGMCVLPRGWCGVYYLGRARHSVQRRVGQPAPRACVRAYVRACVCVRACVRGDCDCLPACSRWQHLCDCAWV